ncbi:hypothetical protein [Candidatus Enterovibrio escicola]|uniref:Mobile element protein n=1 Tax=Candidatus Enterovibrio escicola TaxID=1927127 RepID=A0A2A5T5K3_9GAMM|nr:hypothetical protein [Candidatus Enterovibrio escacola]PCS23408.1 Mobile element protein [Candidatus Enterovibrio escacola]
MLNPLRRKIQQVSAYGAYDARTCHHVLKNKGITPTIPPQKKRVTGKREVIYSIS